MNEESFEERHIRLRAQMRADERAYWRSMAWKLPLFGIPALILLPVIFVALGLWMDLLIDYARSLLR